LHELSYKALRTFLAVVDCGGIGTAAAFINISQPGLSRIITEMEDRLGAKLFERNSKGTFPTAAGEALIPYARALLFDMDQAVAAVEEVRGLKRGVARVGAAGAVARSVLAPAIHRMHAVSPGVKVELREGSDDQLIGALLRREIDLVIGSVLPHHEDMRILAECEFSECFTVFCSVDHPLAKNQTATLPEVAVEHWALPSEASMPRKLFESLFRQAMMPPPAVAMDTMSSDVAVAVVACSRILGWLPRSLFWAYEEAGKVRALHVEELATRRNFFVYQRSRGLLPEAASRLLAEVPLKKTSASTLKAG
jgi:DNA-binding transcriptional LysR family regulator